MNGRGNPVRMEADCLRRAGSPPSVSRFAVLEYR